MRSLVGAVLVGVLVTSAGPARAELQVLQTERWQTPPDRLGLSRTVSGALLNHLDFDLGIWGNYERNPFLLRGKGYFLNMDQDDVAALKYSPFRKRVAAVVQNRAATEITGSIGLFNWVQLFGTLPVVLYQDRGPGVSRVISADPLNQVTLGDIRLGGKIRILRAREAFVDLAFVPQLTLPLGLGFRMASFGRAGVLPEPVDIAYPLPDVGVSRWAHGYNSDGFPTFQPEFALSRNIYGVFLGGNLGLRLRRPYQVAGLTVSQEILGRLGAGFKARQLQDRVKWLKYVPVELGVEATVASMLNHPYVALPYVTPGADKTRPTLEVPRLFQLFQHTAELTATAGLDLFWVHPYVGASVGVFPGVGTPDFRTFAGVAVSTDFGVQFPPKKKEKTQPLQNTEPKRWAWAFGGDADKDGLRDDVDKCPSDPEDKDGFEDEDGCPDPDNDQDGVPDPDDKCPAEKEDTDGFEDGDGCVDPDNDQDGMLDAADKCPDAAEDKDGFEDEDGCPDPDNDQDGVPDADDKCPAEPEDKDSFQDEDGCVDPDNDQDGIVDGADKCPADAEDKDGFEDEDGCPENDNDKDGIPDATDKCPMEPETINGNQDEDGCPDKGKVKVVIKQDRIVIGEKVYFDTGKATLQKRSNSILNQVALVLKAASHIKVRVEGHTDSQGSVAFNEELSKARALAVRAYLVEQGVDPGRLTSEGYGPHRPVEKNDTAKGREANRRVEFVIVEDPTPTEHPPIEATPQ